MIEGLILKHQAKQSMARQAQRAGVAAARTSRGKSAPTKRQAASHR